METIEKKRDLVLQPARHGLAEQLRQDHVVDAEEGTTLDDVMRPGYWQHIAQKLQVFDHVEVRAETGEWVAMLMVASVGRTWARMHLMHKYELVGEQKAAVPNDEHEVIWRGPHLKFAVKRRRDGTVLQERLDTKEAAHTWLQNYERVSLPAAA